jgi:hypothetical protein
MYNYGREYREGHLSTARMESTVDQLVDWRMEKEAAYPLDSTWCANGAPRALCADQRRTGQIHRMVALKFIAGAGRRGMKTPRFFPVPI